MGQLIRKLVDTAGPALLPVFAIVAFGLLPVGWPGYALCALSLGLAWYRHGPDGLGEHWLPRCLTVAAALFGIAIHAPGPIPVAAVLAGALLETAIAIEPLLLLVLTSRRLDTANLPVRRDAAERWWNARIVYSALSVLTLGFLAAGAFAAANPLPYTVLAVATAVLGGVVTAGAGLLWRSRLRQAHDDDNRVTAAAVAHAPRFVVHFAAPAGSEYQLRMWLPYFDQIGDPYLVILRDKAFLPTFASLTSAPVVVAPTIADMESMLVPSVKAVFYVNNSMQNTQCVRFSALTHVQLMHGDSDKPASYNPISAMYDRIFVAGQAGVDRYHNHGIDIPEARFRVVGHPQAARVAVGPRPGATEPVALYAPTWTGHSTDTNFCSLPIAKQVCEALLERGVTMIVRPHPYTRQNLAAARQLDEVERLLAADAERTGRAHVFGKAATERMSLVDCINAADVMVTDASGAASDWLYSERPFAVTDMMSLGDGLHDELPLARAAYVVRRDAGNLSEVCDELLSTDSLAADRHKMKIYYLGDFAASGYEEAFFSAARECYAGR